MTTFALAHGSGDGGRSWHLVQRALHALGHESVAPDLPTDRDDATWDDCVDVLVEAVDGADAVVVVGHSAGGFVVPLVASRVGACMQVHVAGMVPRPGERPTEWSRDVGWSQALAAAAAQDGGLTGDPDPLVAFYQDVPASLAREAMERERPTSERLSGTPWPGTALPDVPTRYVVTTQDRFLPPAVQRRVAAERLGITDPDELAAGHCVTLSRPEELARLLARHAASRGGADDRDPAERP